MAEPVAPWTLSIASDLRMLATARAFIEAVCQAAGFDEATTHAIVLAADEAVNNVIRHAHQDRPDAVVQIQCFLQPDGLEIRLIDEGAPFDITAVPYMDPGDGARRRPRRLSYAIPDGRIELSAARRGRQHSADGQLLRPAPRGRRRPRLTVQRGRCAFLSPLPPPSRAPRRLPGDSSLHPSPTTRRASRAQLAPATGRPQCRAGRRPDFPESCPVSRRY